MELRSLWKPFYDNMVVNTMCFVIDSCNPGRLPEAKQEFTKLLHEASLRNSLKIIVLYPCHPIVGDRISRDQLIDVFDLYAFMKC